jgi:hypothetical protein
VVIGVVLSTLKTSRRSESTKALQQADRYMVVGLEGKGEAFPKVELIEAYVRLGTELFYEIESELLD